MQYIYNTILYMYCSFKHSSQRVSSTYLLWTTCQLGILSTAHFSQEFNGETTSLFRYQINLAAFIMSDRVRVTPFLLKNDRSFGRQSHSSTLEQTRERERQKEIEREWELLAGNPYSILRRRQPQIKQAERASGPVVCETQAPQCVLWK